MVKFTRRSLIPSTSSVNPVVLKVPTPFQYDDNKIVSWKYGIQSVEEEKLTSFEKNVFGQGNPVSYISDIRGMT